MKVSLSLEKTCSEDVSIVVDSLRASTTITVAFDNFKKVIPCFTPEQAIELNKKYDGVLAGERTGAKIEGFDIGNSPTAIQSYKTEKDILILTTSNGTRVMEDMNSTILIGTFTNCKAVAKAAVEIATTHIDVVMAGFNSNFGIDDYLGAGSILYWIEKELENIDSKVTEGHIEKDEGKYYWKNVDGLTEFAKSAIIASADEKLCKKAIKECRSGKRLTYLGYEKDVEFCTERNVSNNVPIYKNGILELYNLEK